MMKHSIYDFIANAGRFYFSSFIQTIDRDYQTPTHIQKIIKALEGVERGEIKRLIVNMPPRHGKSQTISKYFPAWYLGRNPNKNVIFSTYSQDFADDFGRSVRNCLIDSKYQFIFPEIKLASDSNSVRIFALNRGGGYFAVGAGGPLTGRGGDLVIIDDPHKNRQEASSPVMRRHIINWFKSTLFTRLSPNASIIIVQTRWHENDLCGYLLEQEKENWEIINLPAIGEDDNVLWPERWPYDKLIEIKKTIGSFEFASLYQQKPVPIEGGLFNPAWFSYIEATPKIIDSVRYWDRAATLERDGSDPDYTVGIKMSKTSDNIIIIEDMIRLRGTPLNVQKAILNTASLDGKNTRICIEQDPGSSGKMEVDFLIRMLSGYNVFANKVTDNKINRAGPLAAQIEAGNVKILKAHWNKDFIEEMSLFPFGKHDDIVDAASGAFNYLASSKLNYLNLVKM